jgi:hypothetical protein
VAKSRETDLPREPDEDNDYSRFPAIVFERNRSIVRRSVTEDRSPVVAREHYLYFISH